MTTPLRKGVTKDTKPLKSPVVGQKVPLSALPRLSSLPKSSNKLALVFTGLAYSGRTTPPFDMTGDLSSFDQQELDAVKEIWARVAESYSPFDVDVTTFQTPMGSRTVTVVIGGSCWDWYGAGCSGVWMPDTPWMAYVFPEQLIIGVNDLRAIAQCACHEAGHAYSLQHQCQWASDGSLVTEYYAGGAEVGPIMGWSIDSRRGWWRLGPTVTGPNSFQDDMNILASRLGPRPRETNTNLDGKFSVDGVIETNEGVDRWNLLGEGDFEVRLTQPVSPMLMPDLGLFDAKGNLVAAGPYAATGASIHAPSLPAGRYALAVKGTGDYGCVGQYHLEGKFPSVEPLKVERIPRQVGGNTIWMEVDCPRPWTMEAFAGANPGWVLQKFYGFKMNPSGYLTNAGSMGEKWVRGRTNRHGNDWWFILPSGDLFAWDHDAVGSQEATVLPIFHLCPQLLHDAKPSPFHWGLGKILSYAQGHDSWKGKEWWFQGDDFWCYLLPDGGLWKWSGEGKKLSGTLTCTVDPAMLVVSSLGLVRGEEYLNYRNKNEKWLLGSRTGKWFYLQPDGGFFNSENELMVTLPREAWQDLGLLFEESWVAQKVEVSGDELILPEGNYHVSVVVTDGIFTEMVRFEVGKP